jgi:adenosylhomocysteine nucleosidase
MKNIGIVAALHDEVKDILDNPNFNWQETEQNLFYSKENNIYLILGGVGKVFAAYAASKIMDKVDTLFTFGTSGGLNSEEICSLYLSTEFVELDMDLEGLGFAKGITPFIGMNDFVMKNHSDLSVEKIKKACELSGVKLNFGRSMSGDQFIANPKITNQKKELFGAKLVDMESAAIAKICVKENKEFLALRVISDNANHESGNDWNANVKKASAIFNKILENLIKL